MTTAHLLLRVIHISMGLLALGAGAAAMMSRKGGRPHTRAGTVFVAAMFVMIGTGLTIAQFVRPSAGSVLGGLLTLYFTVTGWATMRAAPGQVGRLQIAAAVLGLGTALLGVDFAMQAADGEGGKLDGFSVRFYLIVGAVALIGAALDARMIRRGGFTGAARTARHLTRMSLAMYMATASFFLGQAKLFPAAVRESGVLNVPVLLVIVGLLWSLVRVRYWPRIRRWRASRTAAGLRSTP
jgi:hypothetical protein